MKKFTSLWSLMPSPSVPCLTRTADHTAAFPHLRKLVPVGVGTARIGASPPLDGVPDAITISVREERIARHIALLHLPCGDLPFKARAVELLETRPSALSASGGARWFAPRELSRGPTLP